MHTQGVARHVSNAQGWRTQARSRRYALGANNRLPYPLHEIGNPASSALRVRRDTRAQPHAAARLPPTPPSQRQRHLRKLLHREPPIRRSAAAIRIRNQARGTRCAPEAVQQHTGEHGNDDPQQHLTECGDEFHERFQPADLRRGLVCAGSNIPVMNSGTLTTWTSLNCGSASTLSIMVFDSSVADVSTAASTGRAASAKHNGKAIRSPAAPRQVGPSGGET